MRLFEDLKAMLGIPRPPQPHQVNEVIITQREENDCLVSAVGTACHVTYEKAHSACHHADLPFFLESPILSNPRNAYNALENLGYDPCSLDDIDSLLTSEMQSQNGNILILLHNPESTWKSIMDQHWVVWNGYDPDSGKHELYWGLSRNPRFKSHSSLKKMFEAGWPDCAIIVGEK